MTGVPGGSSLRVALLLESDGPGGAETMLLQLAEALRNRGHSVVPVGPDNRTGWLAAEFRARGFLPVTYSLRRPLDFRCLRGMIRLLRNLGVEVIHSHEFAMAIYGAAAAKRVGVPHIITMHGGRYFADEWRRRVALRWAISRSATTVAVSHATAKDIARSLGVAVGRLTVVPNGVAFCSGSGGVVRRELGVTTEELLVVAVGNLYPVKGHATLVEALALCGAAAPRLRVAIAGRGEEEQRLRTIASQAGVADRLHLLGFRSDVPDLMAAADIFVLPSRSEGLPLALIEAMGSGRPIIASNVGGIPEVVADDSEAILVPAADSGALAGALRRLAEDPKLRSDLSAKARARALAQFSIEHMADAYERIYQSARERQR